MKAAAAPTSVSVDTDRVDGPTCHVPPGPVSPASFGVKFAPVAHVGQPRLQSMRRGRLQICLEAG